jgi:hypothetical protein
VTGLRRGIELVVLPGAGALATTGLQTGVEVDFGPWRRPRRIIPISEIRGAGVENVRPQAHGGWGIRMNLKGNMAVVVRGGEALRLDLPKAAFLVTVDGADGAAKAVNTLLSGT